MRDIKQREKTAWEHFGPLFFPYITGNLISYAMNELPNVGIIKANVLGVGVMVYIFKIWNGRIEDKIDQEYLHLLYASDRVYANYRRKELIEKLYETLPEDKRTPQELNVILIRDDIISLRRLDW